MNAPKSLLKVMNEIESELQEFCGEDSSKELVHLIKERGCGFSVKSNENKHLWVIYENVYIAFNWSSKPSVSLATSGDDNASDSKRFQQDEAAFSRLLQDLRKLKK